MGLYDRQTSIKCNDEELDAYKAAADANGMPLNTWIRLVLDHAAGVGALHSQLEKAARARESAHAQRMREQRAAAAAERRAERERRERGDFRKRGPKSKGDSESAGAGEG